MAKLSLNPVTFTFLFLYLTALVLGQGTQFITGPCDSDADCASGCCGFNSGKCAGAIIALERDGGCGRGDSQANDDAARALGFTGSFTPAGSSSTGSDSSSSDDNATSAPTNTASGSTAIDQSAPGAANVGLGNGAQFITGQCLSDADCASTCCGFNTGKCAGAVIAQTRDGGCGFSGAASGSTGSGSGTPAGMTPEASSSAAGASASSGATGSGTGSQFITGPCDSDADCASGCCGFNSGKCAGAIIAQERDGGCGFGDGVPNDDAAQALRGARRRWSSKDYRRERSI